MKNKTMDKIEKLMHIKTDKNQHVSPDTVFEMCCKINEIIDILNSRLFEPIITVHNQSQKQPEKQEEWERELRFTYGHLYYQNEEGEFCQIVNEIDDLIDFISQLLSESKEKAKIEVLEKVLEKKTNYEIEREEHGYRVTLEYVLADDIKKEIKLLKEGDDLQE